MADIPAAYRQHTGFAGPGVFVVRIDPDSPGERAHILPGDVLTTVGATPLGSPAQFRSFESTAVAGAPVALGYERYGRPGRASLAPVDLDAFFAAPQGCRSNDADALVASAIEAGRGHAPDAENSAAERALNLYEACAAVESTLDEHTLLKSGDALLLQAAARVSQGRRDDALPFAANASAIYRLATHADGVSAAGREAASGKIATIERAFPSVAAASADDSIALGLHDLSGSLSVLASWSAPASDTDTTLHVRVELHPAAETHFFAAGFKITIDSRYIGPQAVYASDSVPATAAGLRLHPKADVDPREDFRELRRVDLAPGESGTYVLTFIVPNDSEFSGAAATVQYAPR